MASLKELLSSYVKSSVIANMKNADEVAEILIYFIDKKLISLPR